MRNIGSLRLLIVALVIAGMAQGVQAGDWPMFGHDAAHSGVVEENVEPPLELLWKYDEKVDFSTPAIFGKIVYVGVGDDSNNTGYVYALDASTGNLKWKSEIGGIVDPSTSPAVWGGIVYVGSFDGHAYALDANTGNLKWKYKTGRLIASSPTVAEGTIYIGSTDGYLYALDANTGNLKWRYQTGNYIFSSSAVFGGMVYIGSIDNCIYALDANTGNLKWKYQTGGEVWSSPTVSGNVVYIGSADNYTYAIDTITGNLKWKYQTGNKISSSPAVSHGTLFVSSMDNYIYALDANRGDLKWKYKTGNKILSSPAVSGGVIYVSSGDSSEENNIYALDTATGALKGQYKTIGSTKIGSKIFSKIRSLSSAAVSDGAVYVGSREGNVYAFVPKNKTSVEAMQKSPYTQNTPPLQRDPTNWIFPGGILAVIAIGIVVLSMRRRERAPKPAPEQPSRAGSDILDAGYVLSKKASSLFNNKDYDSALKTYSKALDKFLMAWKSAREDASLAKSIENNILSSRKNILACKFALGISTSDDAKLAFEEERCEDAERLYNKALERFEDALKDAEELEDADEIQKIQALISKTQSNINSCYIATDKKKVEELSRRASILFKEATTNREKRELFKAREALKRASDTIDEAFTLATNRSFSDARRTLGDLLRSIRNEMNAIDSLISGGVEQIKPLGEVSEITTDQPDIEHGTFPQYLPKAEKLLVLRESEFFNGFIRLKLSVKNKMQHTVTDVFLDLDIDENILRLDHHEPETYDVKKEKVQLGNIPPDNDRTIALYLDPLICAKEGTDINARVDYKDAYGKPDSVRIKPLRIKVVCPIFQTEQDINIGRLKELVSSLPAHGSKVFSLPKGVEIDEAAALCREVIQMHDVRHVRTLKTTDSKTYEAWYYGKTKVERIDLVIKANVSKETESIDVFVAAPDQKALTGLLAELGRNLTKRGEVLGKLAPKINLTIKNSIIQRSRLLDFCDFNGICGANVIIEDSLVQRSEIG